jgi:hypothetical protein
MFPKRGVGFGVSVAVGLANEKADVVCVGCVAGCEVAGASLENREGPVPEAGVSSFLAADCDGWMGWEGGPKENGDGVVDEVLAGLADGGFDVAGVEDAGVEAGGNPKDVGGFVCCWSALFPKKVVAGCGGAPPSGEVLGGNPDGLAACEGWVGNENDGVAVLGCCCCCC